jgi:hypothetical protein
MDAPVFQPEVLSLILLGEFMFYVISTIVVHPQIKRLKEHIILSETGPSDLYTHTFLPDVIFVLLILHLPCQVGLWYQKAHGF